MDEKELKELRDYIKSQLEKGNSDFSWNDYREFIEKISKADSDTIDALNKDGAVDKLTSKLDEIPRFKNYNKRQEIAKGIEGGVEVLRTLSNLSVGQRQRDKARELEAGLQEPSAPPTTAKSIELEEATATARRDLSAPLRDLDPILQQNIQNLRGNLGAAKTASTGQAGIYGSLSQNAFNQAQRANNALIPAIQNIRRQQKAEYNKLISAGISEDDMRFKQSMAKYDIANQNYVREAQAIGNLGAAGSLNVYNQQNELFNQIGGSVSPLINNNLFNRNDAAPQQPPLSQPKPYTAISNLGEKEQDYSNQLEYNLGEWYNGTPSYNPNIRY